MCLAAGLLEDVPFHYEGAREKLLDFPDGIFTLRNAPMKLGDGIGVGDPACAFSVSLEIEPRAERHVTLLLPLRLRALRRQTGCCVPVERGGL